MATAKKKSAAPAKPARKAVAPRRASARPAAKAPARVPAHVAAVKADAGKDGEATRPEKAEKAEKAHKVKVMRDSFTMPKTEFAVLQALKQRASNGGRALKKSEVLRAGVLALAEMGDAAFLAAIAAVPAVKTGRPAKA
jgi:hypothetical protein